MDEASPGGLKEAASRTQPLFNLSRLIHPVEPATFATDYWEKQPLVIQRADPDHYRDLFTLADVDHILSTSRPRGSDLRVLDNGKEIPISELASAGSGNLMNGLEVLYDRYRQGATLNLLFVQDRWKPLRDLCQSLAAELSAGFQTNVYLTPGGHAQGLKPHFDTHDVFVIQVYGTKHWCLYDSPIQLPVHEHVHGASAADHGTPVREFDLRPGDMLYLPRGIVHAATSEETASLHVTIGVLPVLWATVIKDAVEKMVMDDHRFRQALPLGFASDESLQESARGRASELLELLHATASPADMVAEAARRARLERQPVLQGHLLDIEALRSLDLETRVRQRPGLLARLTIEDGQARLDFHGKSVRLPADLTEELHFVTETEEFVGKDIPGGLDEHGRLVLIGTLVREGFLTLS
ncbi:cupin domain-containing protein [Plantactinospora soyae]|uniref:Ribosomal protein L16 Arg81 hydroxylase n=1 Tax=Plantactinospora soyae TaxID=1544732 RepID=A0A927MC88_9ACTN|nr:cupin domain-containing protein [Plantactinospora soyae]MBE1491067.1 ribosomal protein L16 Arg81 hydroxylase [Plantactinospora soyae]